MDIDHKTIGDKTDGETLVQAAEAYLQECGWHDVERDEFEPFRISFSAKVRSDEQTYTVFIETFPRTQCLGVFIYSSFCAGSGSLPEMALLLNHINRRISNGWLAVEGEGSPIQFKQIFDSEGIGAAPKVIRNMIDCGFDTFARFGAALAAVAMTGASSSEAIARLEHHDEPPTIPHETIGGGRRIH